MKAIVKILVGCMALPVMLSGGTSFASTNVVVQQAAASGWVAGQVGSNSNAARRRQADQLLRLARQAMQEGKLDLADKHLQRAEDLDVTYDSLFARFQDTPERLRRDLDELRAAPGRRPSDRFAPTAADGQSDGQQPPPDPFAASATEAVLNALSGDSDAPAATRQGAGLLGVETPELERLPPVSGTQLTSPLTDAEPSPPAASPSAKNQALRLVAQAQAALSRGDLVAARRLADQAQQLRVPDDVFAEGETRPWEVYLEVDSAIRRSGVVPAANYEGIPSGLAQPPAYPVRQGVYDPNNDPTYNDLAQATSPNGPGAGRSSGEDLYQQGLQALEAQDRERALELFRAAWQYQGQLDPFTRQQLRDKLTYLGPAATAGARGEPSPLEEVTTQQELLRQKLFSEIMNEQKAAEQQLITDPRGAQMRMQRLRDRVAQAELDPAARKQLLTLVDRTLNDLQAFIDANISQIELDERNREVLSGIQRDRQQLYEMQDKIAELVEQFNQLYEEQRFAEAEVIAKQVRELDPDSPIGRTLMIKSRFISHLHEQQMLGELADQGFIDATNAVAWSAVPFDDRQPLVFGDIRRWEELSDARREWFERQRRRLSPVEMDIQQKLKEKVEVRFTDRPLAEVLQTLGSLVGVNIYADVEGMAAEGVTSDTPVTINLTQPISLQSALHLILEPLRLSYVIQHEVLRITSEQARDANVYTEVYNVADLIIPIPNFIPGYNVGLPAAIREAHRAIGYGGFVQPVSMGPLTIAANDLEGTQLNSGILAQTGAHGLLSNSGTRPSAPLSNPGGMGGAALADFDTLIELITSTISPESWDTVGGPGAIESFPTNLSLVISQTQDVHDQIADLLEQLRRLQDLQVTIEVRFITLREDFFERIGIDFDFDIDDNVLDLPFDDQGPSVTIGLDQAGNPTADLDLSFTQDSFGLTTPPFGAAANALTGAGNFGFAILSDIEAFFLVQAAQGDVRSNVLQAPKVTLFNGQQASVSDTSQRPFVTSLIPVVGDFAAAHQPVIVVLNEGTSLSVQAVVSSDRRFVRLTLVPIFSQIGEVEEFTFTGSTTTDTGTNVTDPDGNPQINNNVTTTEGTTVQLPTFSFTTVSTTVSVPDGGTVLLGGIKRLREGRNEQGIPMLSKLPYVSRLFRNVGIGRETSSLMLMVTPRIIIQEEEEERLGLE